MEILLVLGVIVLVVALVLLLLTFGDVRRYMRMRRM